MGRGQGSPASSWIISATKCLDGHRGATRIKERPCSVTLARMGGVRLKGGNAESSTLGSGPVRPRPEVRSRLTGRSVVDTGGVFPWGLEIYGCSAVPLPDLFYHLRMESPLPVKRVPPWQPGTCCPKRRKLLLHMIICRANLCSCGERVPPWRLMGATAVELYL